MSLPFNKDDLAVAVKDGLVSARRHPTLPYTVYNYTDKTAYSDYWTPVTINCRGLILDDDFNIVARGYKKFFNISQRPLEIGYDDPVEVMDKADGSLILLVSTPNGYICATRGSFESEQAIAATKHWKINYGHLIPDPEWTFLFEWVGPSNRIVLNYDKNDLVLLGAVHIGTGMVASPSVAKWYFDYYDSYSSSIEQIEYPGPVVETFEYKSIRQALEHMDRPNAEGYVIRSGNYLCKAKQSDYLLAYSILYNLTPRRMAETLKSGKSIEEVCQNIPDEFLDYVRGMATNILNQFDKVRTVCYNDFTLINIGGDRKSFAERALTTHHPSAMFSLLDNRPIEEYIWKVVLKEIKDGISEHEE